MTTERQRRANRQNALKSTGPRTGAGKAIVRLKVERGELARSNVQQLDTVRAIRHAVQAFDGVPVEVNVGRVMLRRWNNVFVHDADI